MAKRRSEVFIRDEVGTYHCFNRIVRRRHLFGIDPVTGKNYNYRKDWVRKEFRRLAKEMAIQVLDYAVLSNHLHAVLRNRPDIVSTWSNAEVVRRWWRTCPRRRKPNGKPAKARPHELRELMGEVDELRKRLSDVSWIMRLAQQRVAQRANKQDDMEGRFFARRFGCERLETEADVLACSLYVDLNWIHAGMAKTPEDSQYTSAFERIRGRWDENARATVSADVEPDDKFDGNWLAPIFVDERAEAYVGPKDLPAVASIEMRLETLTTEPLDIEKLEAENEKPTFYNPVGSDRVSDRGFLAMKLEEYLQMLDRVGRQIRKDKPGSIPKSLPPILERLGIDARSWYESLIDRFMSAPNPSLLPHA